MPRRNRVTPWGEIVATSARGDVMGNRGVLHDAAGNIVRSWQGQRWIICRLHFKNRRRALMQPGRYTELFFLDEATALAAGHRPCAECTRERFNTFRRAWAHAQGYVAPALLPTAAVMDQVLHAARLDASGNRHTVRIHAQDVPDGAMVCLPTDDTPYLRRHGLWLRWTFDGYLPASQTEYGPWLRLITPLPTVGALQSGYVPAVHASAVSSIR